MKQLFLRTCNEDFQSWNGFKWPKEVGAEVVAPDWIPIKVCGYGLHGCLEGKEDWCYYDFNSSAVWMVVEAENTINLGGKHKFEKCVIKHIGDRESATQYLVYLGIEGVHAVFGKFPDNSVLKLGAICCIKAGHYSKIEVDYGSKVKVGCDSKLTIKGDSVYFNAGEFTKVKIKYRNRKGRERIKKIRVGYNGVLPDTWYNVENGELYKSSLCSIMGIE